MMNFKWIRPVALALAFTILATPFASAIADSQLINGAGATFPYPLYSKWFTEYRKVDPSVEINYQSIGSGGGIRQLLANTVDFGASDAPMTEEEMKKSGIPILHIPTVMGAVVMTYNIPGVTTNIQLTPDAIAGIYLGQIKKWNDPKITKSNPGVSFPKDLDIIVAYRSDGSGTTSIFVDYLAKVSSEWSQKVGTGKSVKWPTGLGGKGNEGVTGLVKQTPGSIGYVEFIYAKSNNLPVAKVQNKSGSFSIPSIESVSAAAAGAMKDMPSDFRVSITNASGKESYPISGFTYLLVYQKMNAQKGPKLVKFLNWALKDGQKMAGALAYAPLPQKLVKKVESRMKEIVVE